MASPTFFAPIATASARSPSMSPSAESISRALATAGTERSIFSTTTESWLLKKKSTNCAAAFGYFVFSLREMSCAG